MHKPPRIVHSLTVHFRFVGVVDFAKRAREVGDNVRKWYFCGGSPTIPMAVMLRPLLKRLDE